MILRTRIWNLLDTKHRREAVRTLSSTRGRIVSGRKEFHEFRALLAWLYDRVAKLEREGATPQDAINCLSTATLVGQMATKNLDQLKLASIQFKTPLHQTAENAEFSKRVLACADKLQKRANVWMAEENQWATDEPHDMHDLISRISRLKTWHKMTGVEFENFIINKLRLQGFSTQSTKASGDEGIDIIAVWQGRQPSEKSGLITNLFGGRKYLIQCKRYDPQNAIGQPLLREFYGSMKGTDATAEGIFITTSRFTDSAVEYANRMGIHLIDGPTLDAMLSHSSQET